jgi:hypothetical protein
MSEIAPDPPQTEVTARTTARVGATAMARGLSGVERAAYLSGLILIASGLFHLLVFAVAGGPWEGPVSWRKPATFGTSFGLTLLAVTWLSGRLALSERTRRVLLAVFTVDCYVEVGGITVQAWRKVPSHVDMQGSTNTAISMFLAVGGGVLILVLGRMAVAAWRGTPGLAPSMDLALRAGFATLMIGLLSGAAMIARGVPLARSGHQQEAYHAVGFLKPVHAVSLHGIVVLPLLAWLVGRLDWPEEKRTRVVLIGTWGYAVAIAGALVGSLLSM